MDELAPGLYEHSSPTVRRRVSASWRAGHPSRGALRDAEAPDRIAWHRSHQIQQAQGPYRTGSAPPAAWVTRALVDRLGDKVDTDPAEQSPDPENVLQVVHGRRADDRKVPAQTPPSRALAGGRTGNLPS